MQGLLVILHFFFLLDNEQRLPNRNGTAGMLATEYKYLDSRDYSQGKTQSLFSGFAEHMISAHT